MKGSLTFGVGVMDEVPCKECVKKSLPTSKNLFVAIFRELLYNRGLSD